jgi:hypothetical protein
MENVFGATSTTEDVLSGVNLEGKRIFVTGFQPGLVWRLRGLLLRMVRRWWARREIWPRPTRRLPECEWTLLPMVEASNSLNLISRALKACEPARRAVSER